MEWERSGSYIWSKGREPDSEIWSRCRLLDFAGIWQTYDPMKWHDRIYWIDNGTEKHTRDPNSEAMQMMMHDRRGAEAIVQIEDEALKPILSYGLFIKLKNLNTSLMIRSMDRRSSPFIDGQIWTCRISSLRAEEQIQWWSNLITVSSRIKMTIKFKRKSFNGPNLIEAWNIFWIVGFSPCFIEKLLNFFNNKKLEIFIIHQFSIHSNLNAVTNVNIFIY